MPGGGSFATRLKKKPGAPLGFVEPHLDEAGGGDVAVLVAYVMRLAKARRKVPVVLAQLGEHVLRLHVFGIVVEHALRAGDVPDGLESGASDLTDALGNGVGHRIKRVGLLVQEQMVVVKMRSTHVSVVARGISEDRAE